MNLMRDVFGDRPKLAVLIDPDHEDTESFDQLLPFLAEKMADIILVGGSSSAKDNIDRVVGRIKQVTDIPVLLFPGNRYQLTKKADALLLPSLISGRNPEYLIGKHVEAASIIYNSGIPVFSMGYIMVDGGHNSTAAYITQTKPIPAHQYQLAAQTALAGQLLGMKCIYLESGSGASFAADARLIRSVRDILNIPLIVGGGIKEAKEAIAAVDAGADMVVIGTILEEYPEYLESLYTSFLAHTTI